MHKILAIAVALAVPTASAKAQKNIRPPLGPPPVFASAKVDKAGNVIIRHTVTRVVPETRVRVVLMGGKKVEKRYTVYKPVISTVERRRKLGSLKFFHPNNKPMDAEDVQDLLETTRVVLLSSNGQKVDPYYLRVVKTSTLVIVEPRKQSTLPPPKRK